LLTESTLAELALQWFDQHGRKHLPWQHNKTPYRIWVSEIMLQQTQVSTVIGYFSRFIENFPTVQSLATAPEDAVLHLWTGLGYYSRARNLHRTAKIVVENYHGEFPSDLIELQKLPGIGRSTAGAITAIAFQQPAAILDGNVKRVLTRLYGITEWPGEKIVSDQLWSIAENHTPTKRVADYTQAMMDLGATVCVRGKPHCEQCPLQHECTAHRLGLEKNIPASKPKKNIPVRQTTLLILQNNQTVLLEKRPATGIWGGLWSFPQLTDSHSEEDIRRECLLRFKLKINEMQFGDRFRHTFSHFHLEITPVFIPLKKSPVKIMESEQQIWYKLHHSQRIGLPAPIKKLLRSL